MRRVSIFLLSIAAIGSAIWFYKTRDWAHAITFISLLAGIVGAINYKKEGKVSFSEPRLKIQGGHFESGRIMAGTISYDLEVSNKTNSAITINGVSIKIPPSLEQCFGVLSERPTIQNISAKLEPPRQTITIESNSFITLRAQIAFKSFHIEKLDQAKAIGALAEKVPCTLELQYKTIHASKKYRAEINFEATLLKQETRKRYEENNDHQAILSMVEH